ncbi:hypothetical protein K461DRAFT_317289 [Myriangium duriaei CBS 260.36]|uniref:ATP phosphoribosyltransferase n=1 Tax=Myriangium duriaei CBS 260.36 TaxID=1168546 RepID=A0A9P4JE23_9PEZI|nr:hypothetical protein K461DRAFT_317289 [Myriangium duriaei CBS 260.36]
MASTSASADRYKLVWFTPPTHLAQIKEAVFATGAGSYAKYTQVCFTTPGIGQFKPSADANPTIGEPGKLEEVGEVRCEVLCTTRDQAKQAVEALKRTHPYEEVAYEVYKIEDI